MSQVFQRGPAKHAVELVERDGRLTAVLDGVAHAVDLLEGDQGLVSLVLDGRVYAVDFDRRKIAGVDKVRTYAGMNVFELEPVDERRARRELVAGAGAAGGPQTLVAPMPGKVVRVLVKVGQRVMSGDGLVVVEAMKMENELRAARDGVVKEIAAAENVAVEAGAKLVVVE